MSETGKTIAFVAIAAVVLGSAIYMSTSTSEAITVAEADTGPFFPNWKDALAATSLEILDYDEDTGTPHPFKVMQVDGKWSIPSHSNYPADAQRQLAEAATSVMDLQKLGLATTEKSDHALYGVVDPDPKNLQAGAEGVGKRVTLEDKAGKVLAQFIIGKEVKGQPGVRYVRVPGNDAVYRSEVKPEKLTTKFEDWIEKDLLKLNTFDITQVVLNNYSIDELQGTVSDMDALQINYDDKESKWTLEGAAEGEELNTEKLNAMRTALDDLKIVDVRAKPEGLSRELKQEEGARLTPDDMRSLASKGFFIDRQGRLLSNEGEVFVRMKDGVVYVLRFGQIAEGTGPAPEKKEEATDDAKADVEEESAGSNRYIFVMAQFDPEQIAKPELEPLPGESPAGPEKSGTEKGDKAAESSGGQEETQEDKAAEKTDEKKEEPKSDAQTEEEKEDEAAARRRELERKRKEVEKENKRKQDEYDEKVKKGKDRVKELNDRFADWYYVISDDVYRKIHLTRSEIVKQAEKSEADENSVEALNKIKQEGLKENP